MAGRKTKSARRKVRATKRLAKSTVVVGNTVFGPRPRIGTVRKKRPARRR